MKHLFPLPLPRFERGGILPVDLLLVAGLVAGLGIATVASANGSLTEAAPVTLPR